jgi:CheY-like chemotaxis protein
MSAQLRTVLLVDDVASIRQVLRGAFESAGFHICAEAENGADAIAQAIRHKPDLIILDLSMPVMNGLQAAAELRCILPAPSIILFTGYANSILQEDAAAVGISSVVAKSDIDSLIREAESKLEARG